MNFLKEIKLNSIDKFIGKVFRDQKGIFVGRYNDLFHFTETNEKVEKINWNDAIKRKGIFKLPAQDQLKLLYSTKNQ